MTNSVLNGALAGIAAAIGLMPAAIPSPAQAGHMARVCTNDAQGRLNLRQYPNLSAPRVGEVPNGTVIFKTNDVIHSPQSGYRWHRVSYAGLSGWMRGDYICPVPRTQAGAPVIRTGPGAYR